MSIKKNDIILMLVLLTISVLILVIPRIIINDASGNLTAIVRDSNGDSYEVALYGMDNSYLQTYDGKLGEVVVEFDNGRVRVVKETSPQHICSKQGWSSSTFKPIVCLPNDFYINIVGDNDTGYDGGVG